MISVPVVRENAIENAAAEKKYDRRRKPNEEIIGSDTGL